MKENPIILFDGVCNLCNGAVDFLIRKDRKRQFRFVALQSEGGILIRQKFNVPADCDSVILIYNEKIYYESEAALKISELLHFPWKMAKVFRIIPLKLRNRIYKWIARNRYKWFGKRNLCRVASPAEKIFFPEPEDLTRIIQK
jgi:predicted DCC family thiol-disulfide oxidoreductase YuxK